MWGTELVLVRDDGYPIRTYKSFGGDLTKAEERIDPVAGVLEVISKVSAKEHIWLQLLLRPVMDEWKKEGEKLRDKLIGRKPPAKKGFLGELIAPWLHEIRSLVGVMATGEELEPYEEAKSEDAKAATLSWMTKSEGEVVKAIEDNLNKFGFEVIFRFIYAGKKDVFSKSNVSAVMGALKQFGSQDLNSFKPNSATKTSTVDYGWQAKTMRTAYRKKRLLADYIKRAFPQYSKNIPYLHPLIFETLPIVKWFTIRSKPVVLNVEELATIYHFPTISVKAPLTPKVETKKGEPPSGLPVG